MHSASAWASRALRRPRRCASPTSGTSRSCPRWQRCSPGRASGCATRSTASTGSASCTARSHSRCTARSRPRGACAVSCGWKRSTIRAPTRARCYSRGATCTTPRRTGSSRQSGERSSCGATAGAAVSTGNPPPPHPLPALPCDLSVALPTRQDQALLYRLNGDPNPLHVDPEVATAGGFRVPILHGLCTYGVAGRALLRALCANDAARFRRMDCRLSAVVEPGDTLVTDIWREDEGRAAFRTRALERDVVVLNNGRFEFAEGG